mmetsp:Transcript_6563/g.14139  ORF Transcript_6563/g.14139 Transcript_6563/m.14139 type:complete len:224 (+) Transcript_6563:4196-4867(+)
MRIRLFAIKGLGRPGSRLRDDKVSTLHHRHRPRIALSHRNKRADVEAIHPRRCTIQRKINIFHVVPISNLVRFSPVFPKADRVENVVVGYLGPVRGNHEKVVIVVADPAQGKPKVPVIDAVSVDADLVVVVIVLVPAISVRAALVLRNETNRPIGHEVLVVAAIGARVSSEGKRDGRGRRRMPVRASAVVVCVEESVLSAVLVPDRVIVVHVSFLGVKEGRQA